MQREDAPRALEELERAYHDGLVGWPVVVAGVSGVVVDHERGAPFVRFKTDSDEVKRHRPHQVLPALVAWQREHGEVAKGKVVPEGVVKLATMLFTLAQQLKSMKDAVKAWRKKRAAKREALLAKRRDTTNDIGDHDTQLKSFDVQAAYWDNAEKLEEEFAKSLEAHELCNVLSPFMSLTSIENYFKDKFNMPITRQSIKRRLSGPVGEQVGGRPFLSNAQEEDLAKHVSQMAKRGQVLLQTDVRRIAAELKDNRRGGEIMSMHWYKTWLKRSGSKFDLRSVSVSTLSTACISNFNTVYLDWWYDVTKCRLRELGVVGDPIHANYEANQDAGGEIAWLYPERVLVLDETHVVSRESSQSRRLPTKRCAPASLVAQKQPMRTAAHRDDEVHVTLLAEINLCNETAPPLWILSSKQPRKATQEKMLNIVSNHCTSVQLGKFNSRVHSGSELAWSADGSMTKDNFRENILKVLKPVYPDMADSDPSKRVILFMDGHSSHQDYHAMSELAKRGVYLHYWLPHTTSQCQAPDVNLFGPLKARAARNKGKARAAKGIEVVEAARRSRGAPVAIDHSLDQFAQIKACAEALGIVSKPARLADALRATGIRPFSRKVHENNPTIAIGDVRNEELTLPLGDTSLYKYIQNYEYGNNVPAARAVAQSDNPPVEDDMVQTMMVGSRKGASGSLVVSVDESTAGPATALSQTAVPVSEASSAPVPPVAFTPPPIVSVGPSTSKTGSHHSSNSSSFVSSPRSALSGASNSVRLTGLHFGRASAFEATASMAQVEEKRVEMRWRMIAQRNSTVLEKASIEANLRAELARVRTLKDDAVLQGKLSSAVLTFQIEQQKKIQDLELQCRVLQAKADMLRDTMEDRLNLLKSQVTDEHSQFIIQTERELMDRWQMLVEKKESELRFYDDLIQELDTCGENDKRRAVTKALQVFETAQDAQRDDLGIARNSVRSPDCDYSSESRSILREEDDRAVETLVRTSSNQLPAAVPSNGAPKRRLLPDTATDSSYHFDGAKRPRQALNAVSFSNVLNAKERLRHFLEQRVPPVGQSKNALRAMKNHLRGVKHPMWRECVQILKANGTDFISGATQILKKLDEVDMVPAQN